MLYNDLGKNIMTINRADTYVEKISNKVKMEKIKSRELYLHKESYKEMIIKLGIDLEDKLMVATILKSTQQENQEVRRKLKMLGGEHIQTEELTQVELEKEALMKELADCKDKVLTLE